MSAHTTLRDALNSMPGIIERFTEHGHGGVPFGRVGVAAQHGADSEQVEEVAVEDGGRRAGLCEPDRGRPRPRGASATNTHLRSPPATSRRVLATHRPEGPTT